MGLIDDLKKEAEQRRLAETSQGRSESERENFYDSKVQPQMAKLYTYLRELVETISYLDRKIFGSYKIEGYGEFTKLLQADYQVQIDNSKAPYYIALTYSCQSEGTVEFTISGEKAVEQQSQYFVTHKLDFEKRRRVNQATLATKAIFKLKRFVPIAIEFQVDKETFEIEINVVNIDYLGHRKKRIKIDNFNDALFDNVGKLILREKEDFFNEELSKESLNKIRQALRKQKQELDNFDQTYDEDSDTAAEETLGRVFSNADVSMSFTSGHGQFSPGTLIYVKRSNGLFEAGWKVQPLNNAVPDYVKKAYKSKEEIGPSIICCRISHDNEFISYKVYTINELEQIQEDAMK